VDSLPSTASDVRDRAFTQPNDDLEAMWSLPVAAAARNRTPVSLLAFPARTGTQFSSLRAGRYLE
jgi:hypothetical protein